eukprot:SAG31_NODE_4608_length_3098_cov_3.502167_4_plen_457_part_00
MHISAQSEDAGTSEAQSERQESEDEPIEYDDSSVLQYDCHGTESASQVGVAVSEGECHGASCKGRLLGFAPRTDEGPQQLADGSLTKVYTMDWAGASGSGWLLAAGGHGGRVAVFGGGKQPSKGLSSNGGETLLSWKAHHGWVGHVQFCGRNGDHNGGGSRLLLTASNDKSLMIWDLNKVAGGTPRVASKTLGLHAGGIFSADVDAQSGLAVLTSGKDGATVLSNLRPDGSGWADVGRRFDRHHFGHVVKCCRFQSAGESQLFADTGNSKDICIMDPRLPRNEPSLRLQGVHPTAVNALAWSKRTEWLLASASFSPAVLLHDLRSPSRSIPSLLGHCGGNSARTGRLKAIYHPVRNNYASFVCSCLNVSPQLLRFIAFNLVHYDRCLLMEMPRCAAVARVPGDSRSTIFSSQTQKMVMATTLKANSELQFRVVNLVLMQRHWHGVAKPQTLALAQC